MTYLITGASGFVGNYLIEEILLQYPNAKIIGLQRNKTSVSKESVSYYEVELTDFKDVYSIIEQNSPDVIIHLASDSSVGYSWENPIHSFNNNVNIFLNILEAVRKIKIDCKILSIGSSEEYGEVQIKDIPILEKTLLNPISPYAVARVSQELLSKVYVSGYGLNIIMTRSFNHTGPQQDARFVIPSFAKQIIERKLNNSTNNIETGDLNIIRDFVDVRDVVKAYLLLVEKGENGEVYNICSGIGNDLQSIFKMLCTAANISINTTTNEKYIRPNDNPIIIGNNSKIFNKVGWKPQISLEQSINDIINYWENKLTKGT